VTVASVATDISRPGSVGKGLTVANLRTVLYDIKRGDAFLCLLLALSSFAVFWPALGHNFLINWDDQQYVVQNPAVRGVTLDHVKAAFMNVYVGNYAPLQIISYMLDYDIWGPRASGFIFTNILLHTANALMFFLLLARLSGNKAWPFPAALVFLLHPVQVESVVWIAQRKNLLAMFFFLVSFFCYAVYTEKEENRAPPLYVVSLAAFALAMLAKSVAIILPLVLVLFELCYRKRSGIRRLLVDKIPFMAIAVLFGIVAIKSQSAQLQGGRTSYYGGSPFATFLTMLPVLASYLKLVFWPAGLSAWYNPPVKNTVDVAVAWSALLSLLLAVLGVVLYRRRRPLFFWYALFFVGLLPVSQIVPIVTLMNDRYLYFPMLGGGAFLGLALYGDQGWTELRRSGKGMLLAAAAFSAIVGYTAVTVQRIGVWQDSYTLWNDVVAKSPGAALPHDCFGEALLEKGKLDAAIEQFKIALGFESFQTKAVAGGAAYDFARTHNNLGVAYGRKGMTDEAVGEFVAAIRLKPEYAKAYDNLGSAFMHKGLFDKALDCFAAAVRLDPANPEFAMHLAKTRGLAGTTPVPQK
jgi:tetratricopeptide (TPR) repeat protein